MPAQVFLDLTEKIIIEGSVGIGMRTVVLTHLILGDYPNKPLSRLFPNKRKPTVFRRGPSSLPPAGASRCGCPTGSSSGTGARTPIRRIERRGSYTPGSTC
ncbi:MAG: hypothetical protein AB1Z98_21675 [Nannocystaceae bacterium]